MRRFSPDNDFQSVIREKEWALVYFSATWCGPCKTMGPIMERVASDHQGSVTSIKVDVDEAPELAGRFGLRSVPTLLLFKDGQVVDGQVGSMPKEAVTAWIREKKEKEHE